VVDLEQLGRALADARKAAGLDQETAAARVGVNRITLSRHENGKGGSPGTDVLGRYASTYGVPLDQLVAGSKNVSRGTVGENGGNGGYTATTATLLPRQLRIIAAEFEVEALKLGATEDEMDYVRQALQSPETARMFAHGYTSREGLSDDQIREDYESLVEALRTFVKMRVRQRKNGKRDR
jgi:transcriptional regulator with XRE-family HTH domain